MELRPLAAEDAGELRRILATPDVARWWDPPGDDFPLADDPGSTRFTILVDGAVAGMIQYGEEHDPKYRHASVDLFVDPATRGIGVGRALIEAVYAAADVHGATRVYWHTENDNARAQGLYDQLAAVAPFIQYRRKQRA